jgi:nucleoside-diphosphate-sugar epimerase
MLRFLLTNLLIFDLLDLAGCFGITNAIFSRREIMLLPSAYLLSQEQNKPICVIGANGETGRECVKLLADNKQYVRAVSRKPLEIDDQKYVESLQIDIRDSTKIDNIVKGVSSVIFLANAKKKYRYYKTDTEQFQNYEDIDIYALQNIANACIKHTIPRLVYVSASCRSCEIGNPTEIDKISGIECENCMTKQAGENIIRKAYANVANADYTIVRVGYIFNGENRGVKDIELNQDFTKSGMISRTDLANICIQAAADPSTARTTFEAYYRDTTQPYDVKDSLQKCTNIGKTVEECFFGSEYKNKKPGSMEEVRKKPIKGSLFTTGNEYQGSDWQDLFKDLRKDRAIAKILTSPQANDEYDLYKNIKSM